MTTTRAHAIIRSGILSAARSITRVPASPDAVLATAAPLLAWVEEGADTADMDARERAISDALRALRRPFSDDEVPGEYFGDPERLLADAHRYYGFVTARQPA